MQVLVQVAKKQEKQNFQPMLQCQKWMQLKDKRRSP